MLVRFVYFCFFSFDFFDYSFPTRTAHFVPLLTSSVISLFSAALDCLYFAITFPLAWSPERCLKTIKKHLILIQLSISSRGFTGSFDIKYKNLWRDQRVSRETSLITSGFDTTLSDSIKINQVGLKIIGPANSHPSWPKRSLQERIRQTNFVTSLNHSDLQRFLQYFSLNLYR